MPVKSPVSKPQFKFALAGAGPVSQTWIGRLAALRSSDIGPIAAMNLQLASRISNKLRAGFPVRSADAFAAADLILFHAPLEQQVALAAVLHAGSLDWPAKSLIFCDCSPSPDVRRNLQSLGAAVVVARSFGVPGNLLIEAERRAGRNASTAVIALQRIARQLQMQPVEIPPASSERVDAAVLLGTAPVTALIDRAAQLLREAGVRSRDAARIASAVFDQTARDYQHSGKQSWTWYLRKPSMESLQRQISAAGPEFDHRLRDLLLFSLQQFGRHKDIASQLAGQVKED